jgi:hypothetical protein
LLHFSYFYHLAVLISGSLLHNVFSAVSCSCTLKNMGLFSSFYKNRSSFRCYPLQPPSIKSCHLFLVMDMLVCMFDFPVMLLLWYRINTHACLIFLCPFTYAFLKCSQSTYYCLLILANFSSHFVRGTVMYCDECNEYNDLNFEKLYFWYTLRIVRKFKLATTRKKLVIIFQISNTITLNAITVDNERGNVAKVRYSCKECTTCRICFI